MSEDDEDSESSSSTQNLEINELLCWFQNMIGTIPDQIIIYLCCAKFLETEIKAARDILYSYLISDSSKPEFIKRKASKKFETTNLKFASEIYQLL